MRADKRKVVLIGTGMVGMSYAYSLLNQNVCDELVLIDKHAAHERINYEKYFTEMKKSKVTEENIESFTDDYISNAEKVTNEVEIPYTYKDGIYSAEYDTEQFVNALTGNLVTAYQELMQDVQNQAYALTDELRRIQKDEKTNAAARAVRAREIARKDTEQLLNRTEKKQPKRQFVPLKEVKPGQEVVIAELDQHAVVLSRPDKNGMVEVRAGILKTKVPLTGLCAPDKMDKRTQKQEPPRTRTRVELNHDRKSSMELNLLGYTVEEALAEVDRFLDHAMLSNQNTVYIIHGKGTGALRNAIQKHLRTHRGVKSFRLGRYGEGESGVTVVELK